LFLVLKGKRKTGTGFDRLSPNGNRGDLYFDYAV
jgi:hypothetical protein